MNLIFIVVSEAFVWTLKYSFVFNSAFTFHNRRQLLLESNAIASLVGLVKRRSHGLFIVGYQ